MRWYVVPPYHAPPSLSCHGAVIVTPIEAFAPSIGNRSDQFHGPQSDGCRTRIHGNLRFVGLDGPSGQFLEEWLHIGRNHRHIRWNIGLKPLGHEGFHRLVLQRVVRSTTKRPPTARWLAICGKVSASLSSSPLTSIRNAWNTRLAGLPAGRWACGTARRQPIELPRSGQRFRLTSAHDSPGAICLEKRSSP